MSETWKLVSFSDTVSSLDSKRIPIKSTDRTPGPYPYWGASGIVDHVSDYIFDHPTLLISEDGENLRSRKTPIAFYVEGKYWVNNHAHVFVAKEDYDLRFLSYLMEQIDVSGYITGSTQPKLTAGALAKISINAPSLQVQESIASVLGSFDDLIQLNNSLGKSLRDMVEARFHTILSTSSTRQKLGAVIDFKYGKALPARERNEGSVVVVSSAGIVGVHDVALVDGPGIVVGRKGTVGSITWVESDFFPIDTAFYVESKLPLLFAYLSLKQLGLDQMNTDSAVPGLNRTNALSREIVVPSNFEIENFSEFAIPLWEAASQLDSENVQLAGMRDELLPLLLSGALRVREVAA